MSHATTFWKPFTLVAALAAAVGVFCAASPAAAEEPASLAAEEPAVDYGVLSDSVTVRPASRSLISRALAEAFSQSTDGLQIFATPGGGTGVGLDGRFRHVLMVRINSEGEPEIFCVNHPQEAAKILGTPATAAELPGMEVTR